jgi:hypothetical protein
VEANVDMPDELAETAAAATDPLRGVEVGPFPRFRFDQHQWARICRLSGIPASADEARRDIEILVGIFRQERADDLQPQISPPDIRKELWELAEIARSMYNRLFHLTDSRTAHEALTLHEPQRLSQTLTLLSKLPKWFLVASHRVENRPRGPKTQNVYWLIGNLDAIRKQWTGRRITRSSKRTDGSRDFIKYVCSIADPHIGTGTVERAMKARIKTAVD